MIDISEICFIDKKEQLTTETCGGCKHLYFNNDGSADCDSPCARACLMGDKRIFKEKKMDINVYFNDNVAVSSIDIHDANSEEVVQVLHEICNYDTIDARYGNENFKLYHKNLEIMDERDEWKAKYEKALEQITELEKSAEELNARYVEIEKLREIRNQMIG